MKSAMVETSTRRMRIRVGDVLEGTESGPGWSHTDRLEITYIGRGSDGPVLVVRHNGHEVRNWTLGCRDWKRVGRAGGSK